MAMEHDSLLVQHQKREHKETILSQEDLIPMLMDSSWWSLTSKNAQKYNLIAEVIVRCYNNYWVGGGSAGGHIMQFGW
jgi:hypothetical protein